MAKATGQHSYDDVLPLMLIRYCGPGLLGLGITALVAGFMSGMAGNVSAFSTVWTYDLYGAFINKKASDSHYVAMGRWSTVIGMLVSICDGVPGDECVVDHGLCAGAVQLLYRAAVWDGDPGDAVEAGDEGRRVLGIGGGHGGVRSPCLCGCITTPNALRYVAMSPDAQPMAENLYRALWSWLICVGVTIAVSMAGKAMPETELANLVYGVTPLPDDGAKTLWQKPIFWAAIVIVVFFILNIVFF